MASPLVPEPKFFLVDEEYGRGLEYYADRYFASAQTHQVARGEKSTNYLESEAAAERIAHCLPRVKLVFVLRNPVHRAISNYLWSKKNGIETLDLLRALESEEERSRQYSAEHRYSRPFSYVSRGMYARLLEPYLRRFAPGQVHILLYETLLTDAEREMRSLFSYLGVSRQSVAFDLTDRMNSAWPATYHPPPDAMELLEDTYRGPNKALSQLLGIDLSVWASKA